MDKSTAVIAQQAAAEAYSEVRGCMIVASACEDAEEAELWLEWARALQRTAASQASLARRLCEVR